MTGHYFMGRPLAEMSRDELLEVIEALADELGREREGKRRVLDAWNLAISARAQRT